MSLRNIECVQGELEWFEARAGIPTASRFADVMAKGRAGQPSKVRRTYMLELAGERLTNELADLFEGNRHTERGQRLEPEARELYTFRTGNELTRVGFLVNDKLKAGGSPDSLVGTDGILEVKTKLPHLQLGLLLDGVMPEEHKAQTQGLLWLTGRKWVDFFSYWPGLPPFMVRTVRDEAYIAELAVSVRDFNNELDAIVQRFAA